MTKIDELSKISKYMKTRVSKSLSKLRIGAEINDKNNKYLSSVTTINTETNMKFYSNEPSKS